MITVGAFEAKTNLSALLDKVAAGEEVLITRHGKAMARLVKAKTASEQETDGTIADLRKLRTGSILGTNWKVLRDEGRQ